MTVHRILIADDDPELCHALASRCRQMGIAVDLASTARQALMQLESRPPELAILDVDMPEGSGLAVCEMVMHNAALKHMPVIILTGSKDPQTVQRCHQLRAFYVTKCADVWPRIRPLLEDLLEMQSGSPGEAAAAAALSPVGATPTVVAQWPHSPPRAVARPPVAPAAPAVSFPAEAAAHGKPLSTGVATSDASASTQDQARPAAEPSLPLAEMIDAVFDALGADESFLGSEGAAVDTQQPARPWVLSIDDDESFSFALQLRLQERGVDVLRAFGGREGYRSAFHNSAQAIILDYNLPEGNADYVLRRLKENPVTKDIPVIVLTGNRDRHLERQMYSMGADFFMNKPYDWNVLWQELSRHLTFPEDGSLRFDASAALQTSV